MFVDLIEYLTTPCSWRARSLGFLRSSLQVQARFRRCQREWQPHLARTRQSILAVAEGCASRRKVVILGAGLLHDIPLRELSVLFGEVVLVDVVFPWASRVAAAGFRNVTCVAGDVLEIWAVLQDAARGPRLPLPLSEPTRFLQDPALDLTISVNLLSQLPFMPTRYVQRWKKYDETELAAWAGHLQAAHLRYLRTLPGHVALITDTAGTWRDRAGTVVEQWSNLHGLQLPPADASWEWALAPAPEADSRLDHVVTVVAYADWKSAAAERQDLAGLLHSA